MSKLKHTPGPWKLVEWTEVYALADANGEDHDEACILRRVEDLDGKYIVSEEYGVSRENLHLIAAAPELFLSVALTRELLQSIVPLMGELDRLEGTKYKSLLKEIIHTQDLLIAKAEGKVEETAEVEF